MTFIGYTNNTAKTDLTQAKTNLVVKLFVMSVIAYIILLIIFFTILFKYNFYTIISRSAMNTLNKISLIYCKHCNYI